VKRRLRDAGLLGRVAKKKPYLRLANKNKRLRRAKEPRHWTEELCREGQHPRVTSSPRLEVMVADNGPLVDRYIDIP
jgi:hypothetical protein